MQSCLPTTCLIFLAAFAAGAQATNPLAKVIDMLGGLETKVKNEGIAADALAEETKDICNVELQSLSYAIEDSKKEISGLEATIAEESATISSSSTKVDEVSAKIAADEEDLKAATKVRKTEAGDFAASEKELVETISTLERAIGVLKREMAKGSSALMQVQKVGKNIVHALSVLVDAALLNAKDAAKLTAFVQQQANQDDDDDETGAPAAAAYEGQSGSIVDVLEELYEKAQGSLADLRKKEVESKHNFQMLEVSLANSMKYAKEDVAETAKSVASAKEAKADAAADLAEETKMLKSNEEAKAATIADCDQKAAEYVAEKKSRAEELEALAKAKAVMIEMTGAAGTHTYSFLQIDSDINASVVIASPADLVNDEAIRFVRDLAKKFKNDHSLAQLSMRMANVARMTRNSADPFAKVKKLISDMIAKLTEDASAEATHKAFCDKELGDSAEKRAALSDTADGLTTQIDKKTAKSQELKVEVADLQKQLSECAAMCAEAMKIRGEEKAAFTKAKAALTEGIKGVETALKVLREYYSQGAGAVSEGGKGVISMIEVVESDFRKGLTERTVAEQMAADAFEKKMKEDAINKVTMESDVKYKSKEIIDLTQEVKALSSDLAATQSELEAVNSYLASIDGGCVAKPMTYEERSESRKAMISGLKEALSILEGAAFVQKKKKSVFRGARLHPSK